MKTSFTPGPWTIRGDTIRDERYETISHISKQSNDFPFKETLEADANALLIAAAPDLIAVLVSCITDDAQGIVDRGNGARRLNHITQLARYAIGLATTGQKL